MHEWWRSGAAADAATRDSSSAGLAAESASRSLPASGSAFAAPDAQALPEPATPATPVTPARAVSFDPHVGILGAGGAREPWVPPGRRRARVAGGGIGALGAAAAAAAAAAALCGGAPVTPRSALRASAAPFTLPPPSPRAGIGLGPGAPGLLLAGPRVAAGASSAASPVVNPSKASPAPSAAQLQFAMSPLDASAALGELPAGLGGAAAALIDVAGAASGRADGAWEEGNAGPEPDQALLPVLAVRVPLAAAVVGPRSAAGAASIAMAIRPALKAEGLSARSAGSGGDLRSHPGAAGGGDSELSSLTASLSSGGSHGHVSSSKPATVQVGFSPATPAAGASPRAPTTHSPGEGLGEGADEEGPGNSPRGARPEEPPALRGFAAGTPVPARRRAGRSESHHSLVSLLSASLNPPRASFPLSQPPAGLPPLALGATSRALGARWGSPSTPAGGPPRASPRTPRQGAQQPCSSLRGAQAQPGTPVKGTCAGGGAGGAGEGGLAPAPAAAAAEEAGGDLEAGAALPEPLAAALRQLPAEVLAKLTGPYRCVLASSGPLSLSAAAIHIMARRGAECAWALKASWTMVDIARRSKEDWKGARFCDGDSGPRRAGFALVSGMQAPRPRP